MDVFSGGTYGLVVGHIAPEAQVGGPIAYLRTGDMVTVDQDTKEITTHVPDEELAKRKAETELPPLIAVVSSVSMLTSFHQHHVVRLLTSGIWINQVKLNHIL